jgi:hypothetical protein
VDVNVRAVLSRVEVIEQWLEWVIMMQSDSGDEEQLASEGHTDGASASA